MSSHVIVWLLVPTGGTRMEETEEQSDGHQESDPDRRERQAREERFRLDSALPTPLHPSKSSRFLYVMRPPSCAGKNPCLIKSGIS